METLEVIAEFLPDSAINVIKILWKGEPFDLSYKLFHQWKEGDWIHIYSICRDKRIIIELKYDMYYEWEISGFEPLV